MESSFDGMYVEVLDYEIILTKLSSWIMSRYKQYDSICIAVVCIWHLM